jgi:hypothetical protein
MENDLPIGKANSHYIYCWSLKGKMSRQHSVKGIFTIHTKRGQLPRVWSPFQSGPLFFRTFVKTTWLFSDSNHGNHYPMLNVNWSVNIREFPHRLRLRLQLKFQNILITSHSWSSWQNSSNRTCSSWTFFSTILPIVTTEAFRRWQMVLRDRYQIVE